MLLEDNNDKKRQYNKLLICNNCYKIILLRVDDVDHLHRFRNTNIQEMVTLKHKNIFGDETDYITFNIPDGSDGKIMLRTLIGRYYINDKNNIERVTKSKINSLLGKTLKLQSPIFCQERVIKSKINSLLGKTLKLQSPIFCQSKKICHKCYGDLMNYINNQVVLCDNCIKHYGTISSSLIHDIITNSNSNEFYKSKHYKKYRKNRTKYIKENFSEKYLCYYY